VSGTIVAAAHHAYIKLPADALSLGAMHAQTLDAISRVRGIVEWTIFKESATPNRV
jgi:hypothetical protein